MTTSVVRKKTVKPSMHENYLEKNGRWEDLIEDETYFCNPGRDEWRTRLIRTMLKEAVESDMLEVMEFAAKYKMDERRIYKWSQQYDDIKRAYDLMKRLLASKRRVGCMRKKLDSYSALRDIHLLDPQDDAVNRYHIELKELQQLKEQVKYLVEIVRPKVISAEELALTVTKTTEEIDV